MRVNCLYDKLISVSDLKPHPKNHNAHPKDQIKRLAEILKYQGWRYPVKVSKKSGFVTSGHGRIEAAKENKWDKVPVNFQDYDSAEQEYADVQADNAIASWSELNIEQIELDLKEMSLNFNRDLLGIKDFGLEEKKGLTDDDELPDKVKPRAKLGDIWELGGHRLMCGDSTSIDAVERLMNGEKADLWLTDPPYGVGMEARERSSSSSASWVNKDRVNSQISNDDKTLDEMKVFWKACAKAAHAATTNKSAYYWFACQGGDQMMMMMMMLGEAGWQVKHELIWVKDQMCLGRADYHYKHEPIIYGWKRKCSHEWHGDRSQVSTLNCVRPKKSDLHPTMKPIELLEPLLNNSSKPGYNVLDTFGGSGSMLIACEKTNRKCFMMELDPHYCDVIVTRWENYTGKKAKLISKPLLKKKVSYDKETRKAKRPSAAAHSSR